MRTPTCKHKIWGKICDIGSPIALPSLLSMSLKLGGNVNWSLRSCLRRRRSKPSVYGLYKWFRWVRGSAATQAINLGIIQDYQFHKKNYQAVSKLPWNLWAWTKLHTKMVTKATERRLIKCFLLKIGHGGRIGRKILRGRNYFCIFYSFEFDSKI